MIQQNSWWFRRDALDGIDPPIMKPQQARHEEFLDLSKRSRYTLAPMIQSNLVGYLHCGSGAVAELQHPCRQIADEEGLSPLAVRLSESDNMARPRRAGTGTSWLRLIIHQFRHIERHRSEVRVADRHQPGEIAVHHGPPLGAQAEQGIEALQRSVHAGGALRLRHCDLQPDRRGDRAEARIS